MENNQNNKEYFTIDLAHIFRTIWYRAWIILLAGLIAGGIGFGISAFVVEPDYSASVLLYVNNNSISLGGSSISLNDLTASKSLVKTYTVLLKNRTTLEKVIDGAGVDYSYRELYNMIDAGAANETEIMRVTVTCKDPYEAARIANSIADELPLTLSEIVDGATMEVVDRAIPNTDKVSPSITKNTAIALVLGLLGATLVLAVLAMLDDTIHNEEYIIQTYDYPILAKVPNLLGSSTKKHGRYGYYYRSEQETKAGQEKDGD